MKRALRRHHRRRIIRKWYNHYTYVWSSADTEVEERQRWARITGGRGSIGCGCVCCSNPRRRGWDNPLTIQERRAFQYDWETEDDVSLFGNIRLR